MSVYKGGVYLILQGVCVLCVQGKGVCVCHIYRGHVHVCTREMYMSDTGGGRGEVMCMFVYKEDVYVKH